MRPQFYFHRLYFKLRWGDNNQKAKMKVLCSNKKYIILIYILKYKIQTLVTFKQKIWLEHLTCCNKILWRAIPQFHTLIICEDIFLYFLLCSFKNIFPPINYEYILKWYFYSQLQSLRWSRIISAHCLLIKNKCVHLFCH